jgi:hypothetical protein
MGNSLWHDMDELFAPKKGCEDLFADLLKEYKREIQAASYVAMEDRRSDETLTQWIARKVADTEANLEALAEKYNLSFERCRIQSLKSQSKKDAPSPKTRPPALQASFLSSGLPGCLTESHIMPLAACLSLTNPLISSSPFQVSALRSLAKFTKILPMKISISLKPYSLLPKHVPPDNIAYRPVTFALKIDGLINNTLDTFWLDCSESEADACLAIARTNFPECTREIEQAIAHALR